LLFPQFLLSWQSIPPVFRTLSWRSTLLPMTSPSEISRGVYLLRQDSYFQAFWLGEVNAFRPTPFPRNPLESFLSAATRSLHFPTLGSTGHRPMNSVSPYSIKSGEFPSRSLPDTVVPILSRPHNCLTPLTFNREICEPRINGVIRRLRLSRALLPVDIISIFLIISYIAGQQYLLNLPPPPVIRKDFIFLIAFVRR